MQLRQRRPQLVTPPQDAAQRPKTVQVSTLSVLVHTGRTVKYLETETDTCSDPYLERFLSDLQCTGLKRGQGPESVSVYVN